MLRKLFEIFEKSESSAERNEAFDKSLEADRMLGAWSAWTLVVERSSTGQEILERSIVPAAYLKEVLEAAKETSCWPLKRLLNPLVSAIVEEDIQVQGCAGSYSQVL